MLIEVELNYNDAQALLHHCNDHRPDSGDFREDARLLEAMRSLASAVNDAMSSTGSREALVEPVDPQLLEAALALFGDKAIAVRWLSRPVRALGNKRPVDVALEDVLAQMARMEHGFGA